MGSEEPARSSSSLSSIRLRSRRIFRRVRMRSRSSPAALRVKVTPRTSSARTILLATSHTTRSTIVAVFPEPAPAITSRGSSGDSMMRTCSSVGGFNPSARAISRALSRAGWCVVPPDTPDAPRSPSCLCGLAGSEVVIRYVSIPDGVIVSAVSDVIQPQDAVYHRRSSE